MSDVDTSFNYSDMKDEFDHPRDRQKRSVMGWMTHTWYQLGVYYPFSSLLNEIDREAEEMFGAGHPVTDDEYIEVFKSLMKKRE